MDKKAFQDDLRTMAQSKKERRSNTALIAEVMDDIEAALARGIRREVILQALQKQGVTLTPQGFQSALRELRKRRKAGKPSPQPIEAKPNQPTNPPAALTPPRPGPNVSGPRATEKDREEYQAFKESIKDLPDRERRKRLEEWREKRDNPW